MPDRSPDTPARPSLPPELERALAEAADARAAFESLPPSHRREYVQWVADGRQGTTRERRAAQTVMRLLGGGGTPTTPPSRVDQPAD
jgi:uncharacterized protein YdeI (YjbR/CyaY-like superfamily)